jgi:hypothetical protein
MASFEHAYVVTMQMYATRLMHLVVFGVCYMCVTHVSVWLWLLVQRACQPGCMDTMLWHVVM